MNYRCNKQYPCKHFTVEFDVFLVHGDTEITSPQWHCKKRDDERCVPNCKEYESEVRK